MTALPSDYPERAYAAALGNLVGFTLLPGRRFDTVGVAPLIESVEFGG